MSEIQNLRTKVAESGLQEGQLRKSSDSVPRVPTWRAHFLKTVLLARLSLKAKGRTTTHKPIAVM